MVYYKNTPSSKIYFSCKNTVLYRNTRILIIKYIYSMNTYQIRMIYVYILSIYIQVLYTYLYRTITHTIHTFRLEFFQNSNSKHSASQSTSSSPKKKSNNKHLSLFEFFPFKPTLQHTCFFCHFLIKSNISLRFSAKPTRRNCKELQ